MPATATATARIEHHTFHGQQQNGVASWLGIPYALAPVGNRRFAPPIPAPLPGGDWHPEAGEPVVAPQMPSRLASVTGHFKARQTEDCLRLGIWAPAAALHDGRPRPVLVWLHGGAWVSGGGYIDWYSGSRWVQEADVVVVGINHRLGALGWLAGDDPGCSNPGLQDIALALDWVRTHIHAFGGDAGRITAMGQSAGGANIAALMQRETAFQQAIVQSAPLGRPMRTTEEALAVRQLVLSAWGVQTLTQARELPLDVLLRGQHDAAIMAGMKALGIEGQPYTVIADGQLVPATQQEQALRAARRLPSVVGATREEMTAFPGMQRTPEHLSLGWQTFNAGAEAWQQQAHAAGQACWRYEFQFGANPVLGACHCIDLPFTFGTFPVFEQAAMLTGGDPSAMEDLAQRWRTSLQRFVIQGAPGWDQQALHLVAS